MCALREATKTTNKSCYLANYGPCRCCAHKSLYSCGSKRNNSIICVLNCNSCAAVSYLYSLLMLPVQHPLTNTIGVASLCTPANNTKQPHSTTSQNKNQHHTKTKPQQHGAGKNLWEKSAPWKTLPRLIRLLHIVLFTFSL